MTPKVPWIGDAWERQFEVVTPFVVRADDQWVVARSDSGVGAYIAKCGHGVAAKRDAELVCDALNFYERSR